MFQAQANRSSKAVKIPWRAVNQGLASAGAPSIDVNSFGMRYDSEDSTGILHNIINDNRDSFSKAGIILEPDDVQPDIANTNMDTAPSEVEKMAHHELKSK
jgi:hypothetical protein